ncbi:MAG: BON domain-containing protein [Pirellulaceae bacterium]|nr:BON domain-containing protein [Pirellulaceae bacterium]
MKRYLFGTLCLVALGCDSSAPTGNKTQINEGMTRQAVDRDNTGVNVRDRDSTAKTPFDQNENQADIGITAKIRAQVVETEMSINAHNIKIMTANGKVTLRGPVESLTEKKQIEAIAVAVAGEGNVDSQLEVSDE